MKFKDFENNPQELIGKIVIYERGVTYSDNYSRMLDKIEKVTKTGFKISSSKVLFSLIDGNQKGLTGRMNMGIISRCQLITEEEADSLV